MRRGARARRRCGRRPAARPRSDASVDLGDLDPCRPRRSNAATSERAIERPRVDGGLVRRRARRRGRPAPSPGSSSRQALGREPLGLEPVRAHQLVPAPQLGRLVAVERDVQRAELEVADVAAGRRGELRRELAARAGARRAPSSSSRSSPQVASPTGASIPAATPEAPAPGSVALEHDARRARAAAARQAQARPITPAPTTIDVRDLGCRCCCSPRACSLSRAGGPRIVPAPALPGSGSDGRRPVAALSAHSGSGSRCYSRYSPRWERRNPSSSSASSSRPRRAATSRRRWRWPPTTSSSTAATRRARGAGVARGHDEIREADRRAPRPDRRHGLGAEPDPRSSGRDLAVVETEVSIEGRSSRINVHRPRRLAGRASRAT